MNAPAAAEAADVGALFARTAARLGAQPALIHRGVVTSFAELGARMETLAHGWTRAGVTRGSRVAVLVPPSADFFAATFSLLRVGAVPVLIDPGIGFKNMGRCLAESKPEAFVGSPQAHLARRLARWAKTARLNVVCGGPALGLTTLDDVARLGEGRRLPLPALKPEDRAAILFTSGGTGAPKGAVYEHSVFSAQVELLRALFDIKEGEKSLATFPLFGLFDAALGLTVVIPEMDFTRPGSVDPMAIVIPIQKHGIQQLFGSPALLDRVGRCGARHGLALPSLTRVMSAGAPVPAKVLERFATMLSPGVQIFTPYGATEALPVALIGSAEILGETAARTARGAGVCVGKPVPGVEAAVIRIEDGPIRDWDESLRIPAGRVGEIAVKGPVVTRFYYDRVEETAKAKIVSADQKTFWHRMGDLGYFDEKGRLWFCGRKTHRVKTADGNESYSVQVEGVFNAHPNVKRTALVGVRGRPVLCVEPEPGTKMNGKALTEELLTMGAKYDVSRSVAAVLFKDSFPVDIRHNAKIDREKLSVWAAKRLGS